MFSNFFDAVCRNLGALLHFFFSDYFSKLPTYATTWTIVHYVVGLCLISWAFILVYAIHLNLLADGKETGDTMSKSAFVVATAALLAIGFASPAVVRMIDEQGLWNGYIYRADKIMEIMMLVVPILGAFAALLIYHTNRNAKLGREAKAAAETMLFEHHGVVTNL